MRKLILILMVFALSGCAMDSTGVWGAMGIVPTDAERNAARRQQYVQMTPSLDEETKADILAGVISVGMKPGDVVASWGQPYDINSSGGRYGSREQWLYGYRDLYSYSYWHTTHYLYFEDGELTSWQRVGR